MKKNEEIKASPLEAYVHERIEERVVVAVDFSWSIQQVEIEIHWKN